MATSFKDVNKHSEDLLTKGYKFIGTNKVEVKTSSGGINYTAETLVGNNAGVLVKGDFKFGEFKCDKLEVTDKAVAVELSTVMSGVKTSLKATDGCTGSDNISANLVLDYSSSAFVGSVDVNLLKNRGSTTLAGLYSHPSGALAGLQFEVSPSNLAPFNLQAALGYKTGAYAFAVEGWTKSLKAGFSSKVNGDLSVAFSATVPTPVVGKAGDPATSVVAGLTYKTSADSTLSAKVCNKGVVTAAFSHTLSPLATVTWGLKVDPDLASDKHKFGTQLSIKA